MDAGLNEGFGQAVGVVRDGSACLSRDAGKHGIVIRRSHVVCACVVTAMASISNSIASVS